jgi:hypothetical protein
MIWQQETDVQRLARVTQWRRWFAWHPIWLNDGKGTRVWLEWVERRAEAYVDDEYGFHLMWYDYRLPLLTP